MHACNKRMRSDEWPSQYLNAHVVMQRHAGFAEEVITLWVDPTCCSRRQRTMSACKCLRPGIPGAAWRAHGFMHLLVVVVRHPLSGPMIVDF
mmetsp:Transcript_24072/g.52635  ORF Transcript_24072/g.52635 Transcript_24072/m.52635 type:complete len:92 (+) Transcript_24072:1282-1557(+)